MNQTIENLTTQPEGKTLEFKRDLSSPKLLLRTKEAEDLRMPELQIVEIGMRVRFIVPLLEPLPVQTISKQVKAQVEAQVEAQSEVESGVESGVESEMAIQVLIHLKNEILSKKEIAQKLGKAKPTRYLNDLMRKHVEKGFAEYTIPEKPKSRLQKYQLTEKGKQLITTKHPKDRK